MKFVWASCFSILTSPVFGASIEGVLLERGTRKPLSQIQIAVLPERSRATTNESGRFALDVQQSGTLQVVVIHPGYLRLEEKIEVPSDPGAKVELRLLLERDSYATLGTTVVGQAQRRDSTQRSLKTEEFLKLPGSGGDPVKAVQNLPGVNRSSGFSSAVVIQGSGPGDTRYTIEGFEVPLVFHFGGFSSVVFPEAVESVDYLSAGYGADFGRATGGIVGLRTRLPRRDRVRGLGFVDTFNAGLLMEGPVGNTGGFLVGLRQSYIGAVLRAVLPEDGTFDLTVAPQFRDALLVYNTSINPDLQLKWTNVYSNDSAEFLFKNPADADPAFRGSFDSGTRFVRTIPRVEYRWNNHRSFGAALSAGADWLDVEGNTDNFNISNSSLSARGEWNEIWTPSWKSQIGFDNVYNWTSYNIVLPIVFESGGVSNPFSSGTRVSSSGYDESQVIGLYMKNDFQVENSKWLLNPNLRIDSYRSLGKTVIAPRPQAQYQWSESTLLRFAGGLYSQLPEPGQTDEVFGNPNLDVPRAWHAMTGIDVDFRKGSNLGWSTSNDVFFKQSDKVIGATSSEERYNNSENLRSFGVQTQTKYQGDRYSMSVVYTLSRAKRWRDGGDSTTAPFDQTHLLGWIGSWQFGKNWTLSGRVRFATGNPSTPVVAATYDADNDVYLPTRGALYSERLPAFFQADVRIDKQWIFDSWILSAYLDVQNITNKKNAESEDYAFDYSQKTNAMGLPIFAIFGVKGEF